VRSSGRTRRGRTATDRLRRFGPDVISWTAAIAGALADHEAVAPLLRVDGGNEAEILAAHGRAHLALALVVAAMVMPAADVPLVGADPAAVVGAAVDAASQAPGRPADARRVRRRAAGAPPGRVRVPEGTPQGQPCRLTSTEYSDAR
jgi:hypothetical protein